MTQPQQAGRRNTRRQREIFRRNFEREFVASGLTVYELAQKAGVPEYVIRRWLREGVSQPKHDFIEAVGRSIGLQDARSLLVESSAGPQPVDLATNPLIEQVLEDHPKLFRNFSDEEMIELYSLHATGGALTYEGVLDATETISKKRELRRKFEALLQTHHFHTLAVLIDAFYLDTKL